MKRQTILYGPPGVGKTFRLKEMALNLVHPNLGAKIEEYIYNKQDIVGDVNELLNEVEMRNKFRLFYSKNHNFLIDGEYKPGKKVYRNLTSINKLMQLYIDEEKDSLPKSLIVEKMSWNGPSTYIQHARVLNNFDLTTENWNEGANQLTLNSDGISLRESYLTSYMEEGTKIPDRDIPDFVIKYIWDTLINTTSENMSLWKNIILTTLWLGVETGFIYKYRTNVKETEEEREHLIKCCGYESEDLAYLSWAVASLEDLRLVNKMEESDSRLIKYNLNKDAIKLISNLKIFAEIEEEFSISENEVDKTKYFIKPEELERGHFINRLFSKHMHDLNRIDIVTMHASFSYEDFLEGITVRCNTDKLEYYYKVGILKEISYKALKNLISKNIENENIELEEGINKNEFIDNIKDWKSCFNVYNTYKERLDWDIADNYVLIIDEINRGDIVKVFGETMTLLENDKRIGERGEITVKLPFTQETFGIPKNIHLICTMNTVDRSIGVMDMAFRRRFNFMQIKPDLSLIKELYDFRPIDLEYNKNLLLKSANALDIINMRIATVPYIGQDKLIGHSYIMLGDTFEDENIINAWKYDILPLLEELFYDQFGQLKVLLGYEYDDFIDDILGFDKDSEEGILKFIDFLVLDNG